MPYLSGVLTGIVLTVLVVFLIDHFGSEPDNRMIVNWTVLAEKVGAARLGRSGTFLRDTATSVKGGLKGGRHISVAGSGTACRQCPHPSRSTTFPMTSSNRFAESSRRATS